MNTRQVRVSILCVCMAFAVFGAGQAAAQTDGVWTNAFGGNWSSPDNWLDGNVATGTTGRAWFTNAIDADCYVNLDASPWTLNSLILGNGGEYAVLITNGTLNLDGPAPTLSVGSNSAATVSASLTGSDVTKDGPGTLCLSGSNTYTGATVVAEGTLQLGMNIPSNTVAFWHFNDSGNLGLNASGIGNALITASGTPAYSADGKHGGAMYLDGAATLTTASFPTGVPTGSSPYTIALWEKDNGSGSNGGFVGWGNNTTNQCNNFRFNGSSSLNNYWWSNDFIVSGLGSNPKDGAWHHIAVTWNGALQTMYVDGVSVGTSPRAGLNVKAMGFIVGKTTGDVYFNGWMDDLLIANRAFSQTEIQTIMNDGSSDANGLALPADTPLTVATNALLDLNGHSLTVRNLSGTGTVDTAFAGGASVLTVDSTADTVFAGAIRNTAGTLAFVKKGSGTLALTSRNNSFGGSATIWEGALRLAEPFGYSGTLGATIVMTNGVLRWDRKDNVRDSAPITLYGGTADLQDKSEFFGSLTLRDGARVTGTSSSWFILNGANPGDIKTDGAGDAGAVGVKLALTSQWSACPGNRTQTVNVVTGTRLALSGPIVDTASGSNYVGTVRKTGGGTLVLGGANTYSGGTLVNDGTVIVSNSAALGTGPVTLSGGTLNVATGTWSIANIVNAASNVTIHTEGTLVLFGAITNSGSLVKTGTGTLVLGGSNSYSGATMVNEGTLQLNVRLPGETAALWHFNNPSCLGEDSSTNGNTLIGTTGAPAYNDNGKFGGALYLDGSSTLMNAAFPKGVPTGSSPYTIALWEKDNGSGNTGGFIGWGTAGQNSKANNLRFNGNNALINYWYGNDLIVSGLSVNPKDGNWHHIAVTWDGYNQAMYVDGTVVTNTTRTGLNVGTTGFIVGRTLNDANFKGWMDDLLVASRALSQSEILSVMGNGYMDANVRPLPVNTALTLASGATLDLNGNSQTIADLRGCGTVTGGVLTVTGTLAPGGTNAVGTLTIYGRLALNENAAIDWNFGDGLQDLVQVNGTLALPDCATVVISRTAGSSAAQPKLAVLVSCTEPLAQTDLSGWTATGESGTWSVKTVGNQVVAIRQTGTLLRIQ